VNNADPVKGANGLVDTNPTHVGGGRINIERAANAGVTLSPASMSFGVFTGNAAILASVDVTLMEETGSAQSCSLSLTGIPAGATLTLSSASASLAAGGTATVTITLNGDRTLASNAFWGNLVVTCGSSTYQAPWWVQVQRGNGALNGNQNSPAGIDSPVYANVADMSGVFWTT
jgi:hypothetical protein